VGAFVLSYNFIYLFCFTCTKLSPLLRSLLASARSVSKNPSKPRPAPKTPAMTACAVRPYSAPTTSAPTAPTETRTASALLSSKDCYAPPKTAARTVPPATNTACALPCPLRTFKLSTQTGKTWLTNFTPLKTTPRTCVHRRKALQKARCLLISIETELA